MRTNRAKRIIWSMCLAAVASFAFTACSKKDDPKPGNEKISLKITLTVNGADNNDQVDFSVSAGNHDASQYGAPVWKKNGATQGNEDHILIDEKSFFGSTKTYVFETVKPFDFGRLNVSYSNLDGGPITLSYKTEVDGKVETNVENLVILAGQSQSKNFSYTK